MDITSILSSIKGKVLDATNFELLKHSYDLQNQNIEQLKSNNEALKESNRLLQEKVTRLEKENAKLKEENQDLKTKLKELTSTGKLSELEVKILLLLSSSNRKLTPEMIASSLGLNLTKTEYYLERMYKEKYVYSHGYTDGRPSEYYLFQKGREYLIENNLIE